MTVNRDRTIKNIKNMSYSSIPFIRDSDNNYKTKTDRIENMDDQEFERYKRAMKKTEEFCPPSVFDLPVITAGPVIMKDLTKEVSKAGVFSRENDIEDPVKEPELKQNPEDVGKLFERFFASPSINKMEPVEYIDEKNINKITELVPDFVFADLLDDVLASFGGIQEIIRCNWDKTYLEGELVCLMKDWRVFRYVVKANDFVSLKLEERVAKINRECHIFEDVDDWGHWEELGGKREEQFKKDMEAKRKEQDRLDYSDKYSEALTKFFAGDAEAMTKFTERYGSKSV